MLNYHDIDDLKGKVSNSMLKKYSKDYNNITLSSIIAGFHRVYGIKSEGIAMSLEIVNAISDDTENLWERNLLIWNLYILAREFIDDLEYEESLKIIDRAEKNWSRDIILGDEFGVYHVSWLEQIWLRKAEVYLMINDINSFEEITDRILLSRFKYFEEAFKYTNETIIGDRCTYNCYELMAFERRKRDIKTAIQLIKQAIIHKGNTKTKCVTEIISKYEKDYSQEKIFDLYLQCYFKLIDSSYDNIVYGYCKTCNHFTPKCDSDNKGKCEEFNLMTDRYRACSHFKI